MWRVGLRLRRTGTGGRLLTMLFWRPLHGLIIVGLTFSAAANDKGSAPGLEVLLVSDEPRVGQEPPAIPGAAHPARLGQYPGRRPATAPHRSRRSSTPAPRGTR